MTAQMKPHPFNPFDPISIIGFLRNFKLACDTNGVYKDLVMWLFHFLMNETTSAVLNARLSADGIGKKIKPVG